MRRLTLWLVLAALAVAAIACLASESGQGQAVSRAKDDLAQHLGISAQSIAVASVEKVEWPGSELGLPAKPGPTPEVGLPVIVPGWRIVFIVGDEHYEYHVGEVGEGELKLVRLESGRGGAGLELAPEWKGDKPAPRREVGIPEEPTWPLTPKPSPEREATIQ